MDDKAYIKWLAKSTATANNNKVFEEFDIKEYHKLEEQFKGLDAKEKEKYKNIAAYISEKGGMDLTPLRANYKKIYEEIEEVKNKGFFYDILPIDIYKQEDSIMDLLMSLENENYIKDIYKKKKLRVKNGLNTKESSILVDCIRQGRSLLHAGSIAEMLSKPLIDFYASSAYAYAIIILNSPIHKSIDSLKGSHGHRYNHEKGTIEFGGNIPSGTFIDLIFSMPIAQVNCDGIDLKYSIMKSLDYIQNHTISISLITLLSMVPELQNQYENVVKNHKQVHKLNIKQGMENGKATYTFEIGNGIELPDIERLKVCFNILDDINIAKNYGKYQISVPAETVSDIMPLIYQDVNGGLWYIESPIEYFNPPEICLHFLIISALCNIMRYSPHEWADILSNKVSSEFSLLISRYLRLFEQKFPMMVIQYLTNYLPVLKS